MQVYKDVYDYYARLQQGVNTTHKTAMRAFGHLKEFIVLCPELLQNISALGDAECAPFGNELRHLHDYLSTKFVTFNTTFQLMLELTARCTEMGLQFDAVFNSLKTAQTSANRLRKINPMHLQDAQQVYKNCNRELAKLAATFEKARYKNYRELLQTSEKCFAYSATQALQNIDILNQAYRNVHEASVLGELIAKLEGLEFHNDETLQQIVGLEEANRTVKGVNKDAQYSVGNKGYKIVKELSDE